METKKWYESKTLWVNTLAVALVAVEAQLNILQPMLPVNVYAALAVGLPVINSVLRVVTSKGLTL